MKTLYYSTDRSGQIASIDNETESQIPVYLDKLQARRVAAYVKKEINRRIESDSLLVDFDG